MSTGSAHDTTALSSQDDDKSNHGHMRRVGVLAVRWAALAAVLTILLRRAHILGLHRGRTPIEASTRLVSLVHATLAAVQAARLLHARGAFCTPASFVGMLEQRGCVNTPDECRLLRFSASYWLADLAYLLGFERDPLFLAHHAICLSIWPGALACGVGAPVPLIATAFGEASTPLLNMWWLAKRSGAKRLEQPLADAFTATFIPLRAVILPVYAYRLSASAFAGRLDERIGPYRVRLWSAMLLAAVGGGFVWSHTLVRGALKARLRQSRRVP